MLPLDWKMGVLGLTNKLIRKTVTEKTREMQYIHFVQSEVIVYADEMTNDHNRKL